MTLFRAELARIARRRITKAATVVAVLAAVAIGAVQFFTHSDAPVDWAAANAEAEANTAACMSSMEQNPSGMDATAISDMCYSDPAWFVVDKNFYLQSMLVSYTLPSFDEAHQTAFYRQDYPELNAKSGASGYTSQLAGWGVLIAVGAAVLGASYVGADWRSGVIESQLVRQPRRLRLFGAKFAAVGMAAGFLAAFAGAAVLASVIPAAVWRGQTSGTGSAFWLASAAMIGRIALAAVVFAVVAGGIAMIARNTAAGVAVGMVTFIAGGIAAALTGAWTRFISLPSNLVAWIAQGDVTYTFIRQDEAGYSDYYQLYGHHWVVAGALMALAAAIVATLGASSFAYRDVS